MIIIKLLINHDYVLLHPDFGYARKIDCARMVNSFHLLLAALQMRVYFEWVPSEANTSDLPSRALEPAQWRSISSTSLHLCVGRVACHHRTRGCRTVLRPWVRFSPCTVLGCPRSVTSETVRLRGLFQHSLCAVLSREMVRLRGLFQQSMLSSRC